MTRSLFPSVDDVQELDLDSAIEAAAGRVAPLWPLDRFIAVNPLWGFLEHRLPDAAAHVGALSGARLTMPRAWYRKLWESGHFDVSDVQSAIAQLRASCSADAVLHALEMDEPALPRRGLVTTVRDHERDGSRQVLWGEHVVHSISQHCAAWFDRGQAKIGAPDADGLYPSWRIAASSDWSPAMLMGARGFGAAVRGLPEDVSASIEASLAQLGVPAAHWEPYLSALLLDVKGWASWCAYQRWTARLDGGDDDTIVHLLAIRLAWESVLLKLGGVGAEERWQAAMARWPRQSEAARDARDIDWVLQTALERARHADLSAKLSGPVPAPPPPVVQMAFCIDVRSEVYRRSLEACDPRVQTIGFAGFFGMPMAYRPVGASTGRPQLPGLLAPSLLVEDTGVDEELGTRRASRLGRSGLLGTLGNTALSGFSFVETLGLAFGARLVSDALGWTRPASDPERTGLTAGERAARTPRLVSTIDGAPLTVEARADLAAGILTGLGLTGGLARLVVLAGHGSHTTNNPHAAGYDCGACCGQRGDVNARAVTALLNDPAVRDELGRRGASIPATTWFIGALHDTTTDQVTILEDVPESHRADVEQLRSWLEAASRATRDERAASLGLAGLDRDALERAIRGRTRDWAQVRPEWGLAGNAWFVMAPRARTAGRSLGGRAFLHDYDAASDPEGALLEQLMTAPMVVAHWINFQYYASTVDNPSFGSGNKVLHNVVGGSIGVLEGNGGDLRLGLPMQSLHDGTRLVHEPLRLGVFIEAPTEAIDAVIAKHEVVANLVHNQWIHLHQIDAQGQVWRRATDGWEPVRVAE